MRVLLANDGSAAADAIVERVLRLPRDQLVVRVLGVVDVRPPWWAPLAFAAFEVGGATAIVRELVHDRLAAAGRDTAIRLNDAGIAAHWVVDEGRADRVIAEQSVSWRADMIVVGAHGEHPSAGRRLGPVARSLVAHATVDVDVVPVGSG